MRANYSSSGEKRETVHFPSVTAYVKSLIDDTIHIALVLLVGKIKSIKETLTAITLYYLL